jgi:hypothetical protein
MRKKIIGVIICLMVLTAFIKPKQIANDYRDGYIGNYFCRSTVTAVGKGAMYDTVTIGISKDVLDSVVQIKFGRNTKKFKIKNNLLNPSSIGEHHNGIFFATDSIRLYMYGGHAMVTYVGKKK